MTTENFNALDAGKSLWVKTDTGFYKVTKEIDDDFAALDRVWEIRVNSPTFCTIQETDWANEGLERNLTCMHPVRENKIQMIKDIFEDCDYDIQPMVDGYFNHVEVEFTAEDKKYFEEFLLFEGLDEDFEQYALDWLRSNTAIVIVLFIVDYDPYWGCDIKEGFDDWHTGYFYATEHTAKNLIDWEWTREELEKLMIDGIEEISDVIAEFHYILKVEEYDEGYPVDVEFLHSMLEEDIDDEFKSFFGEYSVIDADTLNEKYGIYCC